MDPNRPTDDPVTKKPSAPSSSTSTTSHTTISSVSTTTTATTTAPTTGGPPGLSQSGIPDNCNKWHLVTSSEENCATVAAKYDISLEQFYDLNPAVSHDCVDGFWKDEAYCKVYAYIPASDLFLGAVLQAVIGRQRAGSGKQLTWLPSLEEFYVLCEVTRYFEESSKLPNDDIFDLSLNLGDIWPILYLKGLHTVRLYNFDPDGFSQLFHHKMYSGKSECRIEYLHIATKRMSICRAEDITALLTLPVALRSISFSWNNDKVKTKEKINGKRRNVWQISNNQFWAAILKYKGTLEYLDIFHDFPPELESRKRRQTDYFGPLTEFAKLRYLSIKAKMLIGGCVKGSVASFRLKETLPATIETLVLATEDTVENIHDLLLQVKEMVSQFPHLTTLEFTETWAISGCTTFTQGATPAIYQPLKEACYHNGVRFSTEGIYKLTVQLQNCPFPLDAGFQYEEMCERATRKAAGLRETPSPLPELRSWGFRTIETHVLPFQDHGGNTAFMTFESEKDILFPPLFNLNIYFTHSEGPLAQTDDMKEDLRAMHARIRANGFDDDYYRLDIYFLPNASSKDCIAHYEAEKATREDSMGLRLEAEIRLDTNFLLPTIPRLPGMVKRMRYIRYGTGFELGQGFDKEWYNIIRSTNIGLGEQFWGFARQERDKTLAIYQSVTEKG
ncbi:LysM peptidoglycan-binding domain-containing protein [Aspergillus affinis]|uniref:LysM peptidoglycan-binding domain-containing protein n=1 Tax=Aspergillus affinis TaxID=1070780 RepID=UPI0022FDDD45|nr:uncharacterized protein KD926_010806 [Aspergillus affinis]KAI9038389.1 hypothetical protein KD926_010806 [Aspergillus affinis]